MSDPVLLGAVLYDPKVSVVWDIIRDFFEENGCPIDVVYYTNYELQVTAHLEGHFDIAWDSPLAWVDTQRRSNNGCRAIAMRDTDRDRVSYWVAPKEITSVEDLKGKTVAVGAVDSPQGRLIPLEHLAQKGLAPSEDFQVKRFDVMVGKHGDHIGGELDAFQEVEKGNAAASAMLDLNWEAWSKDGTIDTEKYHIISTTEPFDHCVFAVRSDFDPETEKKWLEVLHSMSYDNPKHKEMMDLEGLKEWKPGRTTGFGPLTRAVDLLSFFDER